MRKNLGRSRKGAWIEIAGGGHMASMPMGRSRKGAWIEIHGYKTTFDSGYRRSRKGAWIEIRVVHQVTPNGVVAPVRERGLKCFDIRAAS